MDKSEIVCPLGPAVGYGRALVPISEETHEPVSEIDTDQLDSLKALDPNGPIREVDIATRPTHVRFKAVSSGFAISAKGQKRTLATRVAIESGCRSRRDARGF